MLQQCSRKTCYYGSCGSFEELHNQQINITLSEKLERFLLFYMKRVVRYAQ